MMTAHPTNSCPIARRLARWVGLSVALVFLTGTAAFAQLDPLLFLKANQPNVLLVVDLSNRMQRGTPTTYDPANPLTTSDYYDPYIYPLDTSKTWQTQSLLLSTTNTTAYYRRVYKGLSYLSGGSDKFSTTTIAITHDKDSGYATFEAPTRLSVARAALYQAVAENMSVVKFGLIKMRQTGPAVVPSPGGNVSPVVDADPTQQGASELSGNRWAISRPSVSSSGTNGTASATTAVVVAADASNANTTILTTLAKDTRTSGALLPAGNDDANTTDAPVNNMLVDAKTEAARLINKDTSCANTVVVLVVGGGEGTTGGATNSTLSTTASGFLNVASGRRVPVYVIAIAPPSADVASLRAIATSSGGQYFEITKDQIDAVVCQSGASPSCVPSANQTPGSGSALGGTVIVPQVVKAIDTAVQHAFANTSDVNAAPTTSPFGPLSEFQTTSPIIGTANLAGATDINGSTLLPDPDTVKDKAGNVIPQRSNLLITAGFTLPGFDAQIRGFRTYKPQYDATQPSNWKFVADGTRLWVACAPGTLTTGLCSTLSTDARNLYTAAPDGTLLAFTTTNVAMLATYMNMSVADATSVITAVRNLPIGATLDSTPLIMNPPSLDPPPDDSYPAFSVANKDRRSTIFVGTNRGILEAIDSRTGLEVWGFIPYNLLPKLRTLQDGQPVGNFDYFVDGSPKVADVRLSDGTWHTYLFAGEGPGGTFYQAFDVTMAGVASAVPPTSDGPGPLLSYFKSPGVIPLKWTYPLYADFDPTLTSFQLYPSVGGMKPYGDLKASAPALEKTVGQTWSDPAVGQVQSNSSPYVMLVGSGFLPYSAQHLQANRADVVAGTTFYVIDVNDGHVLASKDVGSDGVMETLDSCSSPAVNDCTKFKNALQSDPVATGPSDSRFITEVYLADLDGRVWRIDLTLSGSTVSIPANPTKLYDDSAKQPFFSSLATVNVGGANQYVFGGTGSDILPSNGVSEQYRLLGILDNGSSGTKTFELDLIKVDNTAGDEKVTSFPAVAGDIVFFTTTTFNPATPCSLPSASLHALTFIGGPAYDTNGDSEFDSKDSTLIKTIAGTRASAPFIVDQHLAFTAGTQLQMFGDPADFNNGVGQAGVRILSWRELR
jgi:hypothetical protein